MAGGIEEVPGVGPGVASDFARIGITTVAQMRRRNPERVYEALRDANTAIGKRTHKNFLYLMRMVCYYARDGRDPALLKWNAWTDAKVAERGEA